MSRTNRVEWVTVAVRATVRVACLAVVVAMWGGEARGQSVANDPYHAVHGWERMPKRVEDRRGQRGVPRSRRATHLDAVAVWREPLRSLRPGSDPQVRSRWQRGEELWRGHVLLPSRLLPGP